MTYNTRKRTSETCGCQKTPTPLKKKTKSSKQDGDGDVQVVKQILKKTPRIPFPKKEKPTTIDVHQFLPTKVKQGLKDPKVLDRLATIYNMKSPPLKTAPTKKSKK